MPMLMQILLSDGIRLTLTFVTAASQELAMSLSTVVVQSHGPVNYRLKLP